MSETSSRAGIVKLSIVLRTCGQTNVSAPILGQHGQRHHIHHPTGTVVCVQQAPVLQAWLSMRAASRLACKLGMYVACLGLQLALAHFLAHNHARQRLLAVVVPEYCE